jgi:hypothetical protein
MDCAGLFLYSDTFHIVEADSQVKSDFCNVDGLSHPNASKDWQACLFFSLHRITQESALDVGRGIVISLAISITMHPWFDKCVSTGVFHLH